MSDRPIAIRPQFDNISKTLTALPCWVLWNYMLKEEKWTKIPMQTNGKNASTTNPATWSTFVQVRAAYKRGGFDGVGIVLTGKPLESGLYLIGMDFDHCIEDKKLDTDPQRAIESLNTYSEISPSGQGIRLFLLHDQPIQAKKINVAGKSREIYSSGRYLTVTGQVIGQQQEVRHVA